MIIIGSCAIKHHIKLFRHPSDVDVMISCNMPKPNNVDIITVSESIYNLVSQHSNGVYASLECVYTIKCSHLMFDTKWDKTKRDIIYLKSIGCELIETLYHELVKYWINTNPPKFNLSLDKSKKDFFNDFVDYTIDHDVLHELVSYPNKPLYRSLLKDGHEVLLCRNKFDKLEHHEKLQLFREEIAVIALERWIINQSNGNISWYKAYKFALKKCIISLTKNWARDFIIDNIFELSKPDFNYFNHALTTIKGNYKMSNELLSTLEESIENFCLYEFADGDLEDSYLSNNNYEFIHQDGGGEGGTEYCETVFKLNETYYKMEYSYYSHHGYDFDNVSISEVTPSQKTITVYS